MDPTKEALDRMIATIRATHEKAEARKVTEERPGEDLAPTQEGQSFPTPAPAP